MKPQMTKSFHMVLVEGGRRGRPQIPMIEKYFES